jgi:hypothetical protein
MTRQFGDRRAFAVEFETHGEAPRLWNEWWGSLWLWVDGLLVGNRDETEMIMTAVDSLWESAHEDRGEASRRIANLGAQEVLDVVMWARYGQTNQPPVEGVEPDEDVLGSLEILPRYTGPSFDHWEAALIERGGKEHFIYRHEDGEIFEAAWPVGTYRGVIDEARTGFEQLARFAREEPESKTRPH